MEVLLSTTLSAGTLPPTSAPLQAARASDAQRFAALMQPDAALPPAPSALAAPPLAAATAPSPLGASSVGDRILGGMQSVSEDLQDKWRAVQHTLSQGAGELTMQDMLRLQLQLTQASVQYEMLGKAISKSTQNLDQLVRVQ